MKVCGSELETSVIGGPKGQSPDMSRLHEPFLSTEGPHLTVVIGIAPRKPDKDYLWVPFAGQSPGDSGSKLVDQTSNMTPRQQQAL